MANDAVEPEVVDVDAMSDAELDNFLDDMPDGIDLNTTGSENPVLEEEEGEIPEGEAIEAEDGTVVDDEEVEEEEVVEEEGTLAESSDDSVEEDEGVEEGVEEGTPDSSGEETSSLGEYDDTQLQTMSEAYENLFVKGIKASGGNRTVRDVNHLETLVRIGFSANENNRKIKPYLKQLKSLEQAGVSLEDDNINFVVDLMNGNKDAIKELINKHNIGEDTLSDWMDTQDSEQSDYVPTDNVISDSRFQLEGVLEDIKDSPSYDRTVGFLGNIDDDGKMLISESPQLVSFIHADMENGIFDKALDEANYRMDSGKLPKQSILQSYIQVMQDEEFYAKITGVEATTQTVTPENKPKPKPNKTDIVKRKKMSSTSQTTKTSNQTNQKKIQATDVNKMSDEEFDDFFNSLEVFK